MPSGSSRKASKLIAEFSGPVWRILFSCYTGDPLSPARAPEGRFHHSGQFAIYASLSVEGAGIAIRRYIDSDKRQRVIQKFQVSGARMMDFRGRPEVSVVWQDLRDLGHPSPTWRYSDLARNQGLDGLLYSSRSHPELSHLVLFRADPDRIHKDGAAYAWRPIWKPSSP